MKKSFIAASIALAAADAGAAGRPGAEHRRRQRQAGAEGARRRDRQPGPEAGRAARPAVAARPREAGARQGRHRRDPVPRKPSGAASAASPDFKAQMELARQSILIGLLSQDLEKKTTVSDAEIQKPNTTSSRRSPAAPSTRRATSWSRRKTRPRRSSPRSRPARSSRTWPRRTRRIPGSARERRRPRLRRARLVRARVLAGDDRR